MRFRGHLLRRSRSYVCIINACPRYIQIDRATVIPDAAPTIALLCVDRGRADRDRHRRRRSAKSAERVRRAARNVDRMRNIDPRIVRCQLAGDTVTFHKEATFVSGAVSARQHIFGALRFLDGPFSAFHIVRAALSPPTNEDLEGLARIVRSFNAARQP